MLSRDQTSPGAVIKRKTSIARHVLDKGVSENSKNSPLPPAILLCSQGKEVVASQYVCGLGGNNELG